MHDVSSMWKNRMCMCLIYWLFRLPANPPISEVVKRCVYTARMDDFSKASISGLKATSTSISKLMPVKSCHTVGLGCIGANTLYSVLDCTWQQYSDVLK